MIKPSAEPIDVLVLLYRPDRHALARCVAQALLAPGSRVILAVNDDDPSSVATARSVAGAEARVDVVELGANWGYAGGINRGLRSCRTGAVLLLNDDAFLQDGALDRLAERLRAEPADVVAVCPKIVLDDQPRVIDACGALTTPRAATYNVEHGKRDLGQCDEVREVPGACFAAVLVRKAAFESDDVGPLAEPFFMYSEDADWSLRARLCGYRFSFEATAIVRHVHSASTSNAPPSWKADLIERNSWLLSVRCFPLPNAVFVTTARLGRHGLRLTRGASRRRSVETLAGFLHRLPWALRSRKAIRGSVLRRHPADATLFAASTTHRRHPLCSRDPMEAVIT